MGSDAVLSAQVAERLQRVTNELRDIENLLVLEKLDLSVLTDFRDAVNRVRTTAWAVAQYLETGTTGEQSAAVLSLLANERVRVTYRLCRLIDGDLANGRIQSGPLVQLYLASQDLAQRLSEMLGRDGHQAAAAAAAAANTEPAAD
jgi:hypothetical protein